MIAVRVLVSAPMPVPARMDQHCLSLHLDPAKRIFGDFSLRGATDDQPIEICERVKIETGEVLPTRIPVKRAIEIRSRMRYHLDLADMKLRPGRVTSGRIFTTEKIANHGRRQTFVGDHPVLNRVTYINQLKLTRHFQPPVPAPESSTPYRPARSFLAPLSSSALSQLQSRRGSFDTPILPTTLRSKETCPGKQIRQLSIPNVRQLSSRASS